MFPKNVALYIYFFFILKETGPSFNFQNLLWSNSLNLSPWLYCMSHGFIVAKVDIEVDIFENFGG